MDKKRIKNNLEYFWMYYKWPIMAGAVVFILLVYFIMSGICRKEGALSVMMIDCHTEVSQEQMEQDFIKNSGLDEQKYEVQIQNNLMFEDTDSKNYAMASLSRFMADIGSAKLDVCVMLEQDFMKYDRSGTFLDLRGCMTEKQLLSVKDKWIETEFGEEERKYLKMSKLDQRDDNMMR